MNRLNTFSIFGMLFLSAILLGNGMYSNNISILAQENEAEVEADIEQENKCKKDTECENENEINNQLKINGTQPQQQQQQEPQTCEECFTTILTEQELNNLIGAIFNDGGPSTTQELCSLITENVDDPGFREFLSERLFTLGDSVGINEDKINEILDCLEKIYGTEFPRPPFELSMDSNVGWEITQ
jgi:hypothetical protein